MIITSDQIRGARAMLGLSQAELAERANLSTTGVNNIERGYADAKASSLTAIQRALEAAGIEFTNGGQPGVRLQPRKAVLAAAETYIMANAGKFARSGPKMPSETERAVVETFIRDQARELAQAQTIKDIEESLDALKDKGFFLPQEMVARLHSVFNSNAGSIAAEDLNTSNDE